MMTPADFRPLLLAALTWARNCMPATAFVVDVLWVLNIAPTAEMATLRRRRRMFAATARCSQPLVTRGFYSLLAAAVVAVQRQVVRDRLALDATVPPLAA